MLLIGIKINHREPTLARVMIQEGNTNNHCKNTKRRMFLYRYNTPFNNVYYLPDMIVKPLKFDQKKRKALTAALMHGIARPMRHL
jgi:hypothetical protein